MSSGLYQIRDKNLDTTLDLTRLKPYGDTMNDGKVQTSFTLPVKDDDKGAAAAVMLAQKMGLPVEQTHIGMFDVAQCRKAIHIIENETRGGSSHG